MRLLVVGGNGLLGSNVVYAGRQRGWDVTATYHSTRPAFDIPLIQFDLREYADFGGILDDHGPDVVVNCAAMTDVDACEANPERAHVLNGEAPGALAAQCRATGVDFIHVSTDYVFDGATRRPYHERDPPNPVQAYGESKLTGERAVSEESASALITRLSFVWGIHRSTDELAGFPAWVRDRAVADEAVPLFTDQWVTPTRAGQAAETLLDLIEVDADGHYHVACASCVSPYEFGVTLVERTGLETDSLLRGSVDDVARDAARPRYSCLDVATLESTLTRSQPTLGEDIEAVRSSVR